MKPLCTAIATCSVALFACSSDPAPADDDDDDDSSGDADGGAAVDARPGPDSAPDAAVDDPALAAACAPEIEYVNSSADGNGALFDEHVSDVQAYFAARSLEVCRVLYHQASEVPSRPTLKFVVEEMDGVAYTACGGDTCDEMHFSSSYMRDYADGGGDIGAEIDGVVVHELAHVFQLWDAPGWLIEGEADFVRYRAGYIPESNRHPGGNYDDAYQTTAFFLDYVDLTYPPDFGWKLNQSMDHHDDTDWTEAVFVDLTGKSVTDLWDEYQASL
jgi:basic secretory peptidase family protein